MDWSARRAKMRAIIEGDRCVYPASVSDPVSARIAEHLGFEMGMYAGSVASLVVLGAPDIILLTLTEFAQQALRLNRAAALPLMADADHGYGNALNVMRTVQELETAGIAALSIEDTELPRAFGAGAGMRLISLEEGVGKMKAALEAREDKNLVIVGRTSAPSVNGVADAVKRGKAYEAAGVDAVMLIGIKTRDELDAIASELRGPLILGAAPADLADLDYLSARGIKFALQGHKPYQAAIKAQYDTLKALRNGTPPDDIKAVASKDVVKIVTRDEDYEKWMAAFLE